ncbi:hypothetical protein OG535_01855 [Kitasatospora sp. NBC_00085]|uniref:hypothetical protein n=1 Tax=unclassified Kitasatospora TaxID=2633591 RepID=UPI0032549477
MAEINSRPAGARSRVARGLAVLGLGVAAVVVVAPGALASGTSNKTNGCWSTWGSTGSNAHCQNVTDGGNYVNKSICSWSSDQVSDAEWFDRGASKDNWGQIDCTFNVEKSWVDYSRG